MPVIDLLTGLLIVFLTFLVSSDCLFTSFSDPVEGLLSVDDLMTRGETDDPITLIDSEKDLLVLPYSSGKNHFRIFFIRSINPCKFFYIEGKDI